MIAFHNYILDVREYIAHVDCEIPPHAFTTDEIRAAYDEGISAIDAAEGFISYYCENLK